MSNGSKILPIYARLSSLRAAANLTLEQLAERSGLTKSYLSKLERRVSEPSISSVARLAEAFNISVSEFIGDSVSEEGFRIIPKQSHRALTSVSDIPVFELLHGNSAAGGSRLSVYMHHPELLQEQSTATQPHATHTGEEFIYVLTGKVQLQVADKHEVLNPGDGAWYKSEFAHKLYSIGKQRAEVMIITCSCSIGDLLIRP